MTDLNLDFDIGTKVISVGDTSSDNLGFMKDNSEINLNSQSNIDPVVPNLSVSDGVELLAKDNVSPVQLDEN